MATSKHKTIARRYFEEGLAKGNFEELVSDTYVEHNAPPEVGHGPSGIKAHTEQHRTAFPDQHYEIVHQVEEGNTVVTQVILEGSHTGTLMGMTPTGKKFHVQGVTIHKFHGDKIHESWSLLDTVSMVAQLGLNLTPTAPASAEAQPT